jgi:hypothetical protein
MSCNDEFRFSVSLRACDAGWRWSLIDRDGAAVADGTAEDRAAAAAALHRAYDRLAGRTLGLGALA